MLCANLEFSPEYDRDARSPKQPKQKRSVFITEQKAVTQKRTRCLHRVAVKEYFTEYAIQQDRESRRTLFQVSR